MRALVLAVLAVILASVGCSENGEGGGGSGGSGSGGSGGSGGSMPSFDPVAFCTARRTAICDTFERCYPGNITGECERTRAVATAYAACLADASAAAGRIGVGEVAFDEAGAAACLAEFAKECPGDLWPQLMGFFGIGSPCPLTNFTAGEAATSERCQTAVDCQEGNFCGILKGDCYGNCQAFARKGQACTTQGAPGCGTARCAPGLVCAAPIKGGGCGSCQEASGSSLPGENEECELVFTDFFCQEGLTCKTSVDPTICVPRGAVSAPCQQTWECEFGLVCGNFDETGMGTCFEPLATGEVCSAVFPMTTFFPTDPCEAGSKCLEDDEGVTKCTRLPMLTDGCRLSRDPSPLPCGQGVCIQTEGTLGVCSPPLQQDASCGGADLQEACAPGLRCAQPPEGGAPRCLAPSPDGEVCVENIDCASGRCVSPRPGEPYVCTAADFICE